MKKIIGLFLALLVIYAGEYFDVRQQQSPPKRTQTPERVQSFLPQQSDQILQGEGTVIKVLPDDNKGSRHQRFILQLASGQTLLVAHNIDLAPKLSGLEKGDHVEFLGEYEWNPRGGVIHWTHKDPNGRHMAGWLKYNDRLYQ